MEPQISQMTQIIILQVSVKSCYNSQYEKEKNGTRTYGSNVIRAIGIIDVARRS